MEKHNKILRHIGRPALNADEWKYLSNLALLSSRALIANCRRDNTNYESIVRYCQRGISWGLDFETDSSKGVAFFSATKKPAFLSAAAAEASYVVRGKARDLDSVQASGCQAQERTGAGIQGGLLLESQTCMLYLLLSYD